MVEISQNEARVLKTLVDSVGKASLEDLTKKSGLADSAVARAVLSLSENQFVKERVEKKTELNLTDEGRTFARVGLPERIILLEVKNRGGRLSLKEALQHSKLAEKYGSIATGWISRKKWGTIEKSGSDLVIVARSEAPVD
ncbi:MAG TPA: helix-turn-helix domain-containing protein, partial [Candidatus Bathyarchaeia archaeon]